MKKWNVIDSATKKDEILTKILTNRGFETQEQIDEFINPPKIDYYLKSFSAEFKQSLRDSRDLIKRCIDENYYIVIHGDYDADGVCASSILFNALTKKLGYSDVLVFIPNRFKHGYGLTEKSINEILNKEELIDRKILFVTVDCGITSFNEVGLLKKSDIKVIITDHHQKPSNLPDADVILWNDQMVGSTISMLLSYTLGAKSRSNIALASLATVTDVMSLVGFNRVLVKKGLEILNESPPLGIKKLLEKAGVNREISTYDLGWVIGPRLNAGGRIEDAEIAVEILTSQSAGEIQARVEQIERINQERQQMTMDMYDMAKSIFEEELPKVIISKHEDYHEGIIGLLASRLVQKHNRPSIIISLEGDLGKGSVRSIKGIDIISILREFDPLFESLGGHPMAAGFSIKAKNIPDLEQNLHAYFEENISDELLIPVLDIDLEVPLGELDMEVYDSLSKLEPFGPGNKEPVFVSRNLNVVDKKYVGREKNHVSLAFYKDGLKQKGIFFRGIEHPLIEELDFGSNVDVAYKLKDNVYNGNTTLDLMIQDIKASVQ